MCGIAGVVNSPTSEETVRAMLEHLHHRGPDDVGIWQSDRCAIGVRRLATRGGFDQPIPVRLCDGERIVAFNGEIYRFPATDRALGAIPATPADEVTALLQSEAMGREADGMYAIAEVSARSRMLTLRRDRFGMKPLFWSADNGSLAFASETRALRLGCRQADVSADGIDDVLAFGRVIGDRTVYETIRSVAPGSRWSGPLDRAGSPSALAGADCGTTSNAASDIRAELRSSLEACAYTDRSLGLALSGGLDSSILAYELNDLGVENLTTLSVHVSGRDDGIWDLPALQLPANGSWRTWRHSNVMVTPDDLPRLLAESVYVLDAPHRMTSAPLYVALARGASDAGVVVLITGEGPDELFFGYDSYRAFIEALPDDDTRCWPDQLTDALLRFACSEARREILERILPTERLGAAFQRFRAAHGCSDDSLMAMEALRRLEYALSLEPLLVRADHCLMRHGIEGRMPFLHAGIPAIAAEWNSTDVVRKRGPKALLKAAWSNRLPKHLIEQKKTPFRVPLWEWHAAGAAEWMEKLVMEGGSDLSEIGLGSPGRSQLRDMTKTEAGVAVLFTLCTVIIWLKQLKSEADRTVGVTTREQAQC